MTTAITQTDNAPERCAPAAGYARATLHNLRAYLLRLRDDTAKVKHLSARGEIASAPSATIWSSSRLQSLLRSSRSKRKSKRIAIRPATT